MSSADLVGRLKTWDGNLDELIKEAAAEIERQARIIAAHEQQVKDGAALIEWWKSRALSIEAETREACAKVIEDNQETYRETSNGTERRLTPRLHGNLAGLAFATAIRASAQKGGE
jgi:ATPase subunit of ABC transporter with duplicated ATPase domains